MASVTLVGNALTATLSGSLSLNNLVKAGDFIQLNNQGPLYKISEIEESTFKLTLSYDPAQEQMIPWDTTPKSVSFRIIRSPTASKSIATPLQLPASCVLDLQYSGIGDDCLLTEWVGTKTYSIGDCVVSGNLLYVSAIDNNTNKTPSGGSTEWTQVKTWELSIMFSPTGAIESVNGSPATEPIYLLIGKRDRVGQYQANQTADNESNWANWQDLNNLWVTINPHTGMINTEPMASSASVTIDDSAATIAAGVRAARNLAGKGEGMGGN